MTASEVVALLADIADAHVDSPSRVHITDYAPDSEDYGNDTQPGSAWSEECERKLAEISAALPTGWAAQWSGDDVIVTREGALQELHLVRL